MNRKAKSPVGSRWSPKSNLNRVFVVIDAKPGGKIDLQEEGLPRFVMVYQRDLLSQNIRLADVND